jgi:hypothetical protein
MTTDPVYSEGDPRQLLSEAHELARRVRRDQRATWLPLLILATVTFAAIPFDRYGPRTRTCRGSGPGGIGRVCAVFSTSSYVYWPIALVVAYVAIAALYVLRSRERGVGTPVRPYVTVGVILTGLATALSVWAAHHPPDPWTVLGIHVPQSLALSYVAGPACIIGLALLVLSWVERNRPLFALTIGYLAVVLAPLHLGQSVAHPSPWAFLPHLLLDGGVLLLGGIGFAVADRTTQLSTA